MYFGLFPPQLHQTIWSIAVLFPPLLNYPGSPVSFPAHLTPYQVGTPAFHPHKIFYNSESFHFLKFALQWIVIGSEK